jgi:hypothetical protein
MSVTHWVTWTVETFAMQAVYSAVMSAAMQPMN